MGLLLPSPTLAYAEYVEAGPRSGQDQDALSDRKGNSLRKVGMTGHFSSCNEGPLNRLIAACCYEFGHFARK